MVQEEKECLKRKKVLTNISERKTEDVLKIGLNAKKICKVLLQSQHSLKFLNLFSIQINI